MENKRLNYFRSFVRDDVSLETFPITKVTIAKIYSDPSEGAWSISDSAKNCL